MENVTEEYVEEDEENIVIEVENHIIDFDDILNSELESLRSEYHICEECESLQEFLLGEHTALQRLAGPSIGVGAREVGEDRLAGLTIEENASLFQNRIMGKDGHAGPDRQRQGITGAGINLDLLTIGIQDNLGIESIVLEIINDNGTNHGTQSINNRVKQVMGKGTGNRNALQFYSNSIGFSRADPDRQITVRGFLFKNHDPLVIHQANPDAINCHFNHR